MFVRIHQENVLFLIIVKTLIHAKLRKLAYILSSNCARDPRLPEGWYVGVEGTPSGHMVVYYYTSSGEKLRSLSEVLIRYIMLSLAQRDGVINLLQAMIC